jgi:hypothetical protein
MCCKGYRSVLSLGDFVPLFNEIIYYFFGCPWGKGTIDLYVTIIVNK